MEAFGGFQMREEIGDGILPGFDPADIEQRVFQIVAQEPRAHGRCGLVQEIEQGIAGGGVAQRFRQLEMAHCRAVEGHVVGKRFVLNRGDLIEPKPSSEETWK